MNGPGSRPGIGLPCCVTSSFMTTEPGGSAANEFHLERYKYILQQLHTTNDNVHRFLAIYQTLATAIAGATLALFVGYRQWGITPPTARAGVIGLLVLLTLVALFTELLVLAGIFTWLDYRREECTLTDAAVHPGFREPPRLRNFIRWYETYVLAFILISLLAVWLLAITLLLPAIE
jgi:hypothetical protein